MITGLVNADAEATIRLPVRAADGREREIEAVLDTGFNGSLTLPSALITTLGLPWRGRGLITLANGTDDHCDVYAATIVWDGRQRSILVEAAETAPLLGMTPLHGYRVHIEVITGGSVIIEALP